VLCGHLAGALMPSVERRLSRAAKVRKGSIAGSTDRLQRLVPTVCRAGIHCSYRARRGHRKKRKSLANEQGFDRMARPAGFEPTTPWSVGRWPRRMSLILHTSGCAPVARVYPTVHNGAQPNYPNLTQRERSHSPFSGHSAESVIGHLQTYGVALRSALKQTLAALTGTC